LYGYPENTGFHENLSRHYRVSLAPRSFAFPPRSFAMNRVILSAAFGEWLFSQHIMLLDRYFVDGPGKAIRRFPYQPEVCIHWLPESNQPHRTLVYQTGDTVMR